MEVILYSTHCPRCTVLEAKLKQAGIYTTKDLRNEKISYKIREHSLQKANIIAIIGEKEKTEKTITIREIGSDENKTYKLEEFIEKVKKDSRMPNSCS